MRTVTGSAFKYSTVQCRTVECSTVQYSTVQCSAVQYSTVQYSSVQYSTVQCRLDELGPVIGVETSVEEPWCWIHLQTRHLVKEVELFAKLLISIPHPNPN